MELSSNGMFLVVETKQGGKCLIRVPQITTIMEVKGEEGWMEIWTTDGTSQVVKGSFDEIMKM